MTKGATRPQMDLNRRALNLTLRRRESVIVAGAGQVRGRVLRLTGETSRRGLPELGLLCTRSPPDVARMHVRLHVRSGHSGALVIDQRAV